MKSFLQTCLSAFLYIGVITVIVDYFLTTDIKYAAIITG